MSSISDKEFYNLSISINKALNMMEAPLKMKHARFVIIATHRTREAKSFWAIVKRPHLMENRFTAWKFCHLLHKVLREGHPNAIKHSQTHKKYIIEMGKMWGHLQDGVGTCIQSYTKLLATKLDFHDKNAIFPGSLMIDFQEIEKYAGDDINIYFQLCVEIFDYLDDIIDVQSKVFTSINTYRMTSMTPQGQCRLAPLITLIQDSNPLYDLCVRLMFKLHDVLPNDILGGHRDRFRELFTKLKYFYDNVRPLQYFSDLIQVPHLPESSPNFKSQSDFGSYIPPVMFVQPDPEPQMDNLVDTSSIMEQPVEFNSPDQSGIIALQETIQEKEFNIQSLHNELMTIKERFNATEDNYRREIIMLRDELGGLSNELANSREQFVNMRSQKDNLEIKLASTPTIMQKAVAEEEKAKVSEEKLTKFKTMYSQIREEHINILRQHGESVKLLNKEKQLNSELSSELQQLKSQLTELEDQKRKGDVFCIQNAELETKVEEIKNKYELLLPQNEELRRNYEDLQRSSSMVSEESYSKTQQVQELQTELEQSKSKIMTLEKLIEGDKEAYSKEMSELKNANEIYKNQLEEIKNKYEQLLPQNEELVKNYEGLQRSSSVISEESHSKTQQLQELQTELEQSKFKIITLEKLIEGDKATYTKEISEQTNTLDTYRSQLESSANELVELKKTHGVQIELKQKELIEAKQSIATFEKQLEEQQFGLQNLTTERLQMENELQDLLQQHANLETKLSEALSVTKSVMSAKHESEIKYDSLISSLLHSVLKTLETISASKVKETQQQTPEKALECLEGMDKILNELNIVYAKYNEDKSAVEGLARKSILLCYSFSMLHEQCQSIYNTSTDIEKAEDIANEMNSLNSPLSELFQLFCQSDKTAPVDNCICTIKTTLATMKKMISQLMQASNQNVELGDLVENELSEMGKSIEEAAARFVEMLSNARSKDNGVKLEVNEKILDACTTLMECIKLLIRKSKVLQDEIVSTGRGSTSVKEFYKRNSQWTEGLISASKNVARGANLLVEAANKAVTSESNQNFEIIVAAQEIAACTVQLVIASKVKAPRESTKLSDLTKASRNVSQATGAVVATVKDCNSYLEQSQEVDLTKLTSSQAKTMEMEIHVKVLELEQALQSERLKLASFRRNHYHQNADD